MGHIKGSGLRSLFCLLLLITGHLIYHGPVSAESDKIQTKLTFGIVPQQSAKKLSIKWTPLLKYLEEKTGFRIDFKTAKDIPTFEQRCKDGEYDIAYMNPYHYTVFHESPGYRAIAKEELKSLKGIIVVRRDSPYKELMDLYGETLALPSPAAFAASILTRTHLAALGISFKPRYVLSHDSVYRSVAKGLYQAGGGVPRTFNNIDPEISSQLRILWTSKGYTPHAIAAHPRVPVDITLNIVKAMTEMRDNHHGRELLENVSFTGFVTADDSEWDEVRGLGIKLSTGIVKE
jgi:phosphonate transport system substrate-binding protein